MQVTFPVFYPERPIPNLTCQISYIVIFGCHLGYTSLCYFDKFFNFFFHHCVLPEDVKKQNKQELGTIFKTLQLLYLRVCSKIIRGANIRGFLLLPVKCLCTKIHSTPGMYNEMSTKNLTKPKQKL
jgi:hypothetical protein